MRQLLTANRFALFSFALILAGWLVVGFLGFSGFGHLYTASWWVKAIRFCGLILPPLGVLFAIGSLLFDQQKMFASLALVVSLASAAGVFLLKP